MNTKLQQAKDDAHGLTTRGGAKHAGWVIAGVGAALLMTSAASAAPAPGNVILNPASLPDLSVSMNAPATVPAYNDSTFTVSVTNSPPSNAIITSGGRTVRAHVDLTGMIAVSAQSDAGLSCTVSTANTQTPWSVVDCIGTLAWGASTTILVTFEPGTEYAPPANVCNSAFYCGQPTYADASVSYWSGSTAERSSSNNRAISRIDNTGCIN